MPQGDPQHDNPPEHAHRVIVASLAPSGAERVEQLAVGQRGEQVLDGLQRGAVFQAVPGEERFGVVGHHHGRLPQGVQRPEPESLPITTQQIPESLAPWGKNQGKTAFAMQSAGETGHPWGNGFQRWFGAFSLERTYEESNRLPGR